MRVGGAFLVSETVGLAPTGRRRLSFVVPAGVQPGTVYVQSLILDPGAANGLATLTNGLTMDLH